MQPALCPVSSKARGSETERRRERRERRRLRREEGVKAGKKLRKGTRKRREGVSSGSEVEAGGSIVSPVPGLSALRAAAEKMWWGSHREEDQKKGLGLCLKPGVA